MKFPVIYVIFILPFSVLLAGSASAQQTYYICPDGYQLTPDKRCYGQSASGDLNLTGPTLGYVQPRVLTCPPNRVLRYSRNAGKYLCFRR